MCFLLQMNLVYNGNNGPWLVQHGCISAITEGVRIMVTLVQCWFKLVVRQQYINGVEW